MPPHSEDKLAEDRLAAGLDQVTVALSIDERPLLVQLHDTYLLLLLLLPSPVRVRHSRFLISISFSSYFLHHSTSRVLQFGLYFL